MSWQTTALDGATLIWRCHGDRWWSTSCGDAGVSLRLFARRARIRAWTGDGRVYSAARRPLGVALHVALCEALRGAGLVPLHAAVAVRDGRATALIGPSGVGKSTTLLAAIQDGWLPLGEDFVWLDPATARVQGWSGEHGVRLDARAVRRNADAAKSARWRTGAEGKLELPYDAIAYARPASADLARVLLLSRGTARETIVEPLARRAAVQALWESAGVPLCRVNRDAFAAYVPALISMLEWGRLRLGRGRPTL